MAYTLLAFLRTSAVECAGVRQKKPGRRMNSEEKRDEKEAMRRDRVRLRLKDQLRCNDLTLAGASLASGGRNRCGDAQRGVRVRDGPVALAGEHDPPRGRRGARERAHPPGAGQLHGAGDARGGPDRGGRLAPFAVNRGDVLWDGNGLVVKQVEAVQGHGEGGEEPPRLRLLSANPDYAPYTRLPQDVHVVGKVLWVVRRV